MPDLTDIPNSTRIPGVEPVDDVHIIQPLVENGAITGLTLPLSSLPSEFSHSIGEEVLEKIYIPLEPNETYVEIREGLRRIPKIKVGEEEYSLAEYINVKKGRNREAFEQFDLLMGQIYIRALEENPSLLGVSVRMVDEQIDFRIKDSLGFFESSSNTIFIPSRKLPNVADVLLKGANASEDVIKLFVPERFQEEAHFQAFILSMSDLLNISTSDVLINIRRIALLHELGHALHLNQYLQENGYASKAEWERIGQNELKDMKLWGINNEGLVTKFNKFGVKVEKVDWDEWRRVVIEYSNRNTKTYRNLSYEAYADAFMASYFNKFRNSLLIKKDKA